MQGGYFKKVSGVKSGTTTTTKVSNPNQKNESQQPVGAKIDDHSKALVAKQTIRG